MWAHRGSSVTVIKRKRRIARVGVLLGVLVLLLAALHAAHLTVNISDSMPIGIYRIAPVTRAARAGDIVEVCPPPAAAQLAVSRRYLLPGGPCAYGAIYMIKLVVAVSGDTVDLRGDRIVVNGHALPHSATLAVDRQGNQLPHVPRGIYRLRAGQLWLWTPNPRSWDSRYYGLVPERNVAGFGRLLLAFAPWPFLDRRLGGAAAT